MKKIPLRKCVATQVQCPKQEMIRVVKTKEMKFLESLLERKTDVEHIYKKQKKPLNLQKRKMF